MSWPPIKHSQDGVYKLARTVESLKALGDPHKKLHNIIHIAGTNGKGSTCAFLSNIFLKNGYTCNVYTSPHLVNINERIQLSNGAISDTKLINYTREVYLKLKSVQLESSLTFFEGITVLMFYIFAKEKADFNIIEVGLGGRYDATNVIVNPLLSIITGISLDHQEYLGSAPSFIAVEKCEIIKKSSAIMGVQKFSNAYDVFTQKCQEIGAAAYLCREALTFNNKIDDSYQAQNATLAIKAVEVISQKLGMTFHNCIDAVVNTQWRGRMQTVYAEGVEVLVDCAHNIDGISKFLEYIGKQDGTKVLIFGMLQRKYHEEILIEIRKYLNIVDIVAINFDAESECVDTKLLSQNLNNCVVANGFSQALGMSSKYDKAFLCGSIYMVGEFLRCYE